MIVSYDTIMSRFIDHLLDSFELLPLDGGADVGVGVGIVGVDVISPAV